MENTKLIVENITHAMQVFVFEKLSWVIGPLDQIYSQNMTLYFHSEISVQTQNGYVEEKTLMFYIFRSRSNQNRN